MAQHRITGKLELLNEMKMTVFHRHFSGMLSAVWCIISGRRWVYICWDCHFLIQLSVHPATIHFTIPQNKYRRLRKELKSVSFQKTNFEKVTAFNIIRTAPSIKCVKSNLMRFRTASWCKQPFWWNFCLVWRDSRWFRVTFHGFKKDVFADEYTEEDWFHQ